MNQQLVYLAQSDTTAGFLSQNSFKLASCKKRDPNQPFIICVDSFKTLNKFTRVPKQFKSKVRRAKKTTFIYPSNRAIRVVKDEKHLKFLKKFGWMYSTSANETKKKFDFDYAKTKVDVVVEDKRSFFENTPSKIVKMGKKNLKCIR